MKTPSEPKRKRTAYTAGSSPGSSVPVGVRVKTEDYCEDSKTGKDEHLCVILSHQTVLDCPICFNPLTIPIFQCANGHIICSPCNGKLKHKPKCPSCSINLSNMRNLALERVVESIKVSCSYKIHGCAREVSYSAKTSHEETCAYAPTNLARISYGCPLSDCNFLGSPRNLHLHLKTQHSTYVVPLKSPNCSSNFSLISCKFSASRADELVVLLEEGDDGAMFFLDHRRMRISRIQDPNLSKGHEYSYSLYTVNKCGSFYFKPITHQWPKANAAKETAVGTDNGSQDLLRILDSFYGHDGRIGLTIDISCSLRRC